MIVVVHSFIRSFIHPSTEDAEDESKDIEIPLPNVKSEVLRKVIEFCEVSVIGGSNDLLR